jgi:hypothetical protein
LRGCRAARDCKAAAACARAHAELFLLPLPAIRAPSLLTSRTLLASELLNAPIPTLTIGQASGCGSGPLASDPSLSLHTVSEALRSFFVLISSPDALPEFRSVQQPRLRGEAIARCGAAHRRRRRPGGLEVSRTFAGATCSSARGALWRFRNRPRACS